MSKEAMKLALEALETYHGYMEPLLTVFGGPRVPAEKSTTYKVEKAITVIKEALAVDKESLTTEAQQSNEQVEPVAVIEVKGGKAWLHAELFTHLGDGLHKFYTTPQPKQEQGEPVAEVATTNERQAIITWRGTPLPHGFKLYTTPQQRKPLPKSEWPKHPSAYFDNQYVGYAKSDLDAYAAQVLAAHGIKENT